MPAWDSQKETPVKHIIFGMLIAIGIPAALIGCGSLDSGDSKQDESIKVEETTQALCGDDCVSCVEHDDGDTTCCVWVGGKFQGCETF